MKKKFHKMKLSRETLGHLDDSTAKQVVGGLTEETCSYCGICRTDPCCTDACVPGDQ
jgi:hypothetical protein